MVKRMLRSLLHLPGFHTSRKLILFTSDDWGGVCVRSNDTREALIQAGIDMNSNRFNRFDTLESNDDLENLFEILVKFKDINGNHPVITAVTNVANPDFERIKESSFSDYFYEPFYRTLERYPNHDKVSQLYQKGIELNIFRPELHGREHLNVNWWIESLQNGNNILKKAFENEFWHLGKNYLSNPLQRSLGAAYDITSISEVEKQKEIVFDGANLFEKLFGYRSTLFVPPALHYHKNLESAIADSGLKMVDVPRFRKMPLGNNRFKTRFHYLGQKGQYGLRYLTRNVVFEPNLSSNHDGVDTCLKGIENAFRFHHPAVISNHRAAFVGGIKTANRDRGLVALNKLLTEINKRWPEAEYLRIDQFLNLLNK